MKKLLLLLLLSLGLIGNSYAEALSSSEEPPILSITQSVNKYIEKVLELTEKRKELNPESFESLFSSIDSLFSSIDSLLDEKEYEAIAYLLEEVAYVLEIVYMVCIEAVATEAREQQRIFFENEQKEIQELQQLLFQAVDKRIEVGNRCSLSMDESCEKDIEEADSNIEKARDRLQRVKSIHYELVRPIQYARGVCPNWSFINNESIEEINDSDS